MLLLLEFRHVCSNKVLPEVVDPDVCLLRAAWKKLQFFYQVLGVASVIKSIIKAFNDAFQNSCTVLRIILLSRTVNNPKSSNNRCNQTRRRTNLARNRYRLQLRIRLLPVILVHQHLYDRLSTLFCQLLAVQVCPKRALCKAVEHLHVALPRSIWQNADFGLPSGCLLRHGCGMHYVCCGLVSNLRAGVAHAYCGFWKQLADCQ